MDKDRDLVVESGNKKEKFLCAHCRTGIIEYIPSYCPECGKFLNKKIFKEVIDEKKSNC